MANNQSIFRDRVNSIIQQSPHISRDLSWVQFNYRVLDQAKHPGRNLLERLKFVAITASNLDEFFMIRVGSLYNYIDYNKPRLDSSGLSEEPFRVTLLDELQNFVKLQMTYFAEELIPRFRENSFSIGKIEDLNAEELAMATSYFKRTIFPMLTPMMTDAYRSFPLILNNVRFFGVITTEMISGKEQQKLSFVQIPQNLPRFYEIKKEEEGHVMFLPLEEVIRHNLQKLYRNVEIQSITLMRLTRNGDFSIEDSDDLESDFIDEIKRKLQSRRTGRVVRLEVEPGASKWMMRQLQARWDIDNHNIFEVSPLLDLTGLWQIVNHSFLRQQPQFQMQPYRPVNPLTMGESDFDNLFQTFKKKDVLFHRPFNSMDPLLRFVEAAAQDPNVLAIKMTIYRLAKDSRIVNALLKAVENGKHISVLFELKARFDEENNIRQAKRLEEAGCFVIHGIGTYKTHTKLLLIVRREGEKVTRYVHMSSGNYNEDTAKIYTDIGLISSREGYAQDVAEFFNAITGHSYPRKYQYLLTAPEGMREQLIGLVNQEAENARAGLPSGIVIKVNSLQDIKFINALYDASQAGVPIRLMVRGVCCLRPGRAGMSENIEVRSLVGNLLEHSRLFYFHNNGDPKVYGGSADCMVRSFDRRIESLFLFVDKDCKLEAVNILRYNWKDNLNSYRMMEDGRYVKINPKKDEKPFDSHIEFFYINPGDCKEVTLF